MKIEAKKWPLKITYEVAEDYFEGLESDKNELTEGMQTNLQKIVESESKRFIVAKALASGEQDAERKQNKSNGED